jgi:protein arginine kinase
LEADFVPEEQLILATGLGLSRNDATRPFPHVADGAQLEDLLAGVTRALDRSYGPGEWVVTDLDALSPAMRAYLVERGLMTLGFSHKGGPGRALATYRSSEASLEINGVDHVRLLGSRRGDHLGELWVLLDAIDDRLEVAVPYAFDDHRGYLTAHPLEAGTGLHAYVTLHVPGLMVSGRMAGVAVQLLAQGLAVVPLWEGAGGLFQIVNRTGPGMTEAQITEAVGTAARQVAEKERSIRKLMLRDNPVRVRDYIGRAVGTAREAWSVNLQEGLSLISALLVGVDLGIVEAPGMNTRAAFELMRRVQPGHLAVEEIRLAFGGLDDPAIDEARALLLRRVFAEARMKR